MLWNWYTQWKKVNIKIIPAKEDYGIVFKRTDFKKNNLIKATSENVSSTQSKSKLATIMY